MRNPSDNWEELRDKVLGLGDTSVRKTHYPSLKERLTELEQLTRELKRSEAYLAEAQTLSHTGSFGWKVSTGERIWSEETSRIFELDPAVKPSLDQILERTHPEDRALVLKTVERATASGQGFDYGYRLLMPDGRVKFLHVVAKAMQDASGGIEFVGAVMDITESHQMTKELERSKAYLAEGQTLSHTGSFGWKVSPEEHIWSEETSRIFEFDPAVKPTMEQIIERVHPEDRTLVTGALAQATESCKDFDYRHRLLMPDGSVKYLHVVAKATRDAFGGIEFVGAVMDVTEARLADERIRQSEAALRELIDAIPQQVYVFAPDWSPLFANQREREYTGLSSEEARSKDAVARVFHPEDLKKLGALRERALLEAAPFELEARIKGKDGQYRWFLIRDNPLWDEQGRIIRWYGTRTDIEERKRAEEALRRSESYLADAQRLTHTGVWAGDRTSKPLYWSEEVFSIFGFDPQQGLPTGEQALQRIHPEDFDKFQRATINEKGYLESEYRIVLPDGTLKYVSGSAHPVLDGNGEVVEVVGVVVDITERKRAEEALRRAEGYLVEAQRLTHTGAWATDAVPEPLYWSEELFRLYGLDPQQGFPTHDQAVQRVHPEDRDRYVQAFHRVIHQKVDSDVEFRTVLPDGTIRYLYGLGHPVLNTNGDVVEVVGTTVDITERKRAEQALRESETLFRTFVDHAEDAFFMLDLEQRTIIDVNRCACESLGYTREELIGKTPLAFDVNLDRTTLESIAAQAAAGGTVLFDRHWHRRKDGSLFPVEVQTSAFWHGGRRFLLKVARDITERLKAEEAIRQSEAELRQILDTAPQHLAVLGPDGSRLYLNQATLDYYGWTFERSQTRHMAEFFHPEDWERVDREVQNGLLAGSQFEVEARMPRHDGEHLWFLLRYKPLRNEQGQIRRWTVAAIDIDDRKQAEERLQHENVALREEIDKAFLFEEIVGSSAALRAVLSRVAKVAPTDSTVLITGETGTGKELIARAIHKRSRRSARAFVSVNCAAIPRDLIASELFGHEKGAFTGAAQRHLGRFELAEGGTIFLDEIAELPAETQVALLRVLQEREFERVGGERRIPSNVRVIAATNRDLEAAVAAGSFRSDLFYRLNVFPVEVPPLRDRKEDIPLLVEYFIDRYARKAGKGFRGVNKKSLDRLQSYRWPGNIRELQNIIERSVIVCESENFSVDESWLSSQSFAEEPKSNVALSDLLAAKEKETIEAALRECGGRVSGPSGAAAKLGMPRSTLESKIRSLDVDKTRFKST
jgi:PAS domain S-box-containing protein